MADYLNIAGRIRTTASDGVAMEAQEVKDLNLNKSQQEVNADVQQGLSDRYTKEETYSKEQVNDLIATPDVNYVSVVATNATTAVTDILPATGEANTIYRVGNWDGTQYDPTMYALYAWNGSAYVCLAVRSFVGEVYDISVNHPDGQGSPTPYADLAAALGTNGANIPADIRRGGMSIKFIQGNAQSNDNKYIQARCMANEFTTDVTQWAIYDDEVLVEAPAYIKAETDAEGRLLFWIKSDASIDWAVGVPTPVKSYVDSCIEEILNGNEGTDIDGLNKIIAFLDDFSISNTLASLLNGKVDKEDGKGLIQDEVAESLSVVEEPEFMDVELDSEGRVLGGRKANGNKFENMPIETPAAIIESVDDIENRTEILTDSEHKIISYRDKKGILHEYAIYVENAKIKLLDVGDIHFDGDIPEQIKEYVQEYIPEPPTPEEHDEIPYNDLLSIGSKTLKVYNPYKESKQHQYTGQMHFHSWTKFGASDYPDGFPGEKWEVPYGYSIAAIPAGETNTEKYLWDMPHEKRVAILSALAMAYAWRHKKLGYDFIALSNYSQFQDVTHQPNLSDITYLQMQYPEAYAYFAGLYLNGFDVNDFDANGNLKDFRWLCDSYESTTSTLGVGQHIVVHCAPNFSVPYGSGTFKDVMNRVQDYGCIVHWPHPTDAGTFASPEVMDTVPGRLRFMEIYDGISVRKYDSNGTLANRTYIPAGTMLDYPFDYMLTKGNFLFGMAISDERPTNGRTGSAMFVLNPPKNLKNGCVKVFGDNLTSEELFESLLSGNFYASSDSDASINSVSIENGKYIVDVGIEGVVVEFLKENNTIVKTVTTSAGNTIASYDVDGSEKFVRARIYKLNNLQPRDDYWYWNKEWMIWTQPLFISKTIL